MASGGSAHLDELALAPARPVIEDANGDEASTLVDGDRATIEAGDGQRELLRSEAAASVVESCLEEAATEAPSRPVGMQTESDVEAGVVVNALVLEEPDQSPTTADRDVSAGARLRVE